MKSKSGYTEDHQQKASQSYTIISNEYKLEPVSSSIDQNMMYLKTLLKDSHDIVYRFFYISDTSSRILLVYIDGMVDKEILNKEILNNQILKSLMIEQEKVSEHKKITVTQIKDRILTTSEVTELNDFEKVLVYLLSGNALLFVEGMDQALTIGSKADRGRSIGEPISEEILRGPRDGFVESLQNNIVFIRKRIKDPNLAVEMLKVGRSTQTDVAVVYLKHVAKDGLAQEIKSKIAAIDVDGIIDSAQIEQMIESKKWTIFPQMLATERPDKTAASILEGRVAIIVDGTPFVLIAPATFGFYINNPDDYYERAIISSALRLIRYISYFLSTSLPALYLALIAYHPGMLPTSLALSITGTRIGLPFPTFIEVLFMEFVLEVLHEAAIRLPKPIAQTVSIVGGLVIGQAVVQAGIVSPVIVIIVALTALVSFTIPVYSFTLSNKILRIPLIIAGATLGLYGIVAVWTFIIIHLASLESFNTRFLGEFSPFDFGNLKDTLIKVPNDFMNRRPPVLKPEEDQRQSMNETKKNKENDKDE